MPLLATQLRQHITDVLSARVSSPLTLRVRAEPDRVACGISAFDDLLHGGLPVGVVSEFTGSECSGRTTMAMAYLAASIRAGNVCAWVDVADSLDPESVAANDVDWERLLWVRCGPAIKPVARAIQNAGAASGTQTAEAPPALPVRGGGSPHPRSEGRDMPEAIRTMLQTHGGLYDRQARREKKSIGTPGVPNRPLTFRSVDREEQVASDRVSKPRGERAQEPRRAVPLRQRSSMMVQPWRHSGVQHTGMPWQQVSQALRATDLLLQGGGFSMIVLDLGSVPAECVWRIPSATWFRFRAATERSRTSLLLLTQHSCARSAAELVVNMEPGEMDVLGKVMTGTRYRAATERQRTQPEKLVSIRKPPQSEHGRWKAPAAWVSGQ